MYVNPFWFGVFAAVVTEFIVLIAVALYLASKKK